VTPTRDRLLDEAERLFASAGLAGVATREIVEAAEQRNTSAVSYHFGSREGLLTAILTRRGGPVDARRAELRDGLGERPALRDLVACLVVPYTALLTMPEGRSYVRIVAQLRGRFAAWRVESDAATTQGLARILDEIEAVPDASAAIRRERVIGLIMLLTSAVAERARVIDDGATPDLDHEAFVDNLVAMCAAVVRG
jgi:TetR/AcrR family transcriptional regulator, regulator of cefoperazone and chloramphenicol sensitivity